MSGQPAPEQAASDKGGGRVVNGQPAPEQDAGGKGGGSVVNGQPTPEQAASGRAAAGGAILVMGTVALDEISTPAGHRDDVVGGAAVHFSAAASLFGGVQLVGVVGDDYPLHKLDFLRARGIDFAGLEQRPGRSFRWGCLYHQDMNTRDTTHTELGVFEGFDPALPPSFRTAPWVFLANTDPSLQLSVMEQMESPALVGCDTMNYWIERRRDRLLEVISRIDMITLNDEEAQQLSRDSNLVRAARWIQERGARHVVIKKGEHGAILFSGPDIFVVPGYPLDPVVDPTGAGDAFAGGMFGSLARDGEVTGPSLRRAMVYGCTLGSFTCEAFGARRLAEVTLPEVENRVRRYREMTKFDVELADRTGKGAGG